MNRCLLLMNLNAFTGLRSGTQVFGRVGLAGEVCRLERWVLAQVFVDSRNGRKLAEVHLEAETKMFDLRKSFCACCAISEQLFFSYRMALAICGTNATSAMLMSSPTQYLPDVFFKYSSSAKQ